MNYFSLLFLSVAFTFAGCNKPAIKSDGWERVSEAGVHYSFNRVLMNDSGHPIFVVGTTTDLDKRYKSNWVSSADGFALTGIKLHSGSTPLLYFSDGGSVKEVKIANSGLWLPLFKNGGPTVGELEIIIKKAIKIEHEQRGEQAAPSDGD